MQRGLEADMYISNTGFDPSKLTVDVGNTVTFGSEEGSHKIIIDGTATPTIEEGATVQVTFDKIGKIRVFDIFTKKVCM